MSAAPVCCMSCEMAMVTIMGHFSLPYLTPTLRQLTVLRQEKRPFFRGITPIAPTGWLVCPACKYLIKYKLTKWDWKAISTTDLYCQTQIKLHIGQTPCIQLTDWTCYNAVFWSIKWLSSTVHSLLIFRYTAIPQFISLPETILIERYSWLSSITI